MSKKSEEDMEKIKQFASRNKTALWIGGGVVLVLSVMSGESDQGSLDNGQGDNGGYTQPYQGGDQPYDGGYTQPYQGGSSTGGPSSSDEAWERQEENSRAAQAEWERQEEVTRRNDEIRDKVILDLPPVICVNRETGETTELPNGYSCP